MILISFKHTTRYGSTHLHLVTSGVRGMRFLTSQTASRVVHEHGIAGDTQLQPRYVNSTCRYNEGKHWVSVCSIFTSTTTSAGYDLTHNDAKPLHGRIEGEDNFLRMEDNGNDSNPGYIDETSNRALPPLYYLAKRPSRKTWDTTRGLPEVVSSWMTNNASYDRRLTTSWFGMGEW